MKMRLGMGVGWGSFRYPQLRWAEAVGIENGQRAKIA